jgi:hypothetical protein
MSYKQAQKSACADDWEVAVQKELQQLIDFKTCEVIKPEDIPAGKNITGSKIVFKTKLTADGNIEKRKCRIVALGYSQIYGVDYLENFSPTPMRADTTLICGVVCVQPVLVLQGLSTVRRIRWALCCVCYSKLYPSYL